MKRVDGLNLQIDITADAPDGSYSFEVASIRNPYSQVQNSRVTLKHLVGCQTATACDPTQNCQEIPVNLYQLADTSKLPDTVSQIERAAGMDADYVATTNGSLSIKFSPGPALPRYGGEITITIPSWYPLAGTSEAVFSFNPKTLCQVQGDTMKIENQ